MVRPVNSTLKGAYAKHDRAVRHLRELTRSFTDYAKEQFEIEDQPPRNATATRHVRIVAKNTAELGPLETIIGDCVQNLRASLDYLVYELAITELRKKPRERTQFPIATSHKLFWRHGRHQIAPLA